MNCFGRNLKIWLTTSEYIDSAFNWQISQNNNEPKYGLDESIILNTNSGEFSCHKKFKITYEF